MSENLKSSTAGRLLILGTSHSRKRLQQRRDIHQIAQRRSLLIVELIPVLRRVHISLPLSLRHILHLVKCPNHRSPLILRKTAKLLRGTSNLLPLLWRKLLHRLAAADLDLPLFRRKPIQPGQLIMQAHLLGRLQAAKPRLVLKLSLLLLQRHTAMCCHPLRQMSLHLSRMSRIHQRSIAAALSRSIRGHLGNLRLRAESLLRLRTIPLRIALRLRTALLRNGTIRLLRRPVIARRSHHPRLVLSLRCWDRKRCGHKHSGPQAAGHTARESADLCGTAHGGGKRGSSVLGFRCTDPRFRKRAESPYLERRQAASCCHHPAAAHPVAEMPARCDPESADRAPSPRSPLAAPSADN